MSSGDRLAAAPFLEWFDERAVRYRAAGSSQAQLLRDLGWGDDEAGTGRIRRWRQSSAATAERDELEDALNRVGVQLWELYDDVDEDIGDVTTAWCPTCHDPDVTVDSSGICPWCDTRTRTCAPRRYRLVDEHALERARALYQDKRLSLRRVAEQVVREGLVDDAQGRGAGPLAVRVERSLARAFRARGYALRSRSEALTGVKARGRRCSATTRRGRPCTGNARPGSDRCFQHDPAAETARARAAQLDRMRGRQRWVAHLVPMAPFVAWLEQRRRELALAPQQRRFANRDEGLQRLSRATGIDASTLIKWMRFQNSNGRSKHDITRQKVEAALACDQTTTFAQVYGLQDADTWEQAA